jgi:hypothetical protein
MHRSSDDWLTCDLSDAAHARWVRQGNGFLTDARVLPRFRQPKVHSTMDHGAMLNPLEITTLVNAFARKDAGLEVTGGSDAFDHEQNQWMPTVGSRDGIIAAIVRDVRNVAIGRMDPVPLKFYVSNSDDTTGSGLHWATVALSIETVGEQTYSAMDLTMDSDDEDREDAADLADLEWGEGEGESEGALANEHEVPLSDDEAMEDELLDS